MDAEYKVPGGTIRVTRIFNQERKLEDVLCEAIRTSAIHLWEQKKREDSEEVDPNHEQGCKEGETCDEEENEQ